MSPRICIATAFMYATIAASALAQSSTAESAAELLGGCIQQEAAQRAETNFYKSNEVLVSDRYPPFTKSIQARGLTFVALENIPDSFLYEIARTAEDMFPQNADVDALKQAEILENLYAYSATIPVLRESDLERLYEGHAGHNFENLMLQTSVCDIIMQTSTRQVMEVVEHLLHFVTDVGLHYAYPDQWGISQRSEVFVEMENAIAQGYYDISKYQQEIDDEHLLLRVLIQEFSYWAISTYWDLQQEYGSGEHEWTVATRAELKEKMPTLYTLIEKTVDRVMKSPQPGVS